MEQAHPHLNDGKPLEELRFNAHEPPLKDSLMLLNAQGTKRVFREDFESRNAFLFSKEHLVLDIGDAVYHTDAEGYSLNASIFSRYKIIAQDVSRRGLRKFKLGPEAVIRPATNGGPSHYVDMEVVLNPEEASQLLRPPLYGALNYLLPMDDEVTARVKHENQKMAEMIQGGVLPVSYRVDAMVQNDGGEALQRLNRVLKAGTYVSQLIVVPNKIAVVNKVVNIEQSPRYKDIYPRIISDRPYPKLEDIDSYLDRTYGPVEGKNATVIDISPAPTTPDSSMKNVG
jgi:hypothetical protein